MKREQASNLYKMYFLDVCSYVAVRRANNSRIKIPERGGRKRSIRNRARSASEQLNASPIFQVRESMAAMDEWKKRGRGDKDRFKSENDPLRTNFQIKKEEIENASPPSFALHFFGTRLKKLRSNASI